MTPEEMSYGQLLAEGEKALSEAGISEPETNAWLLFEAAFDMDRTHFFLRRQEMPDEESRTRFGKLIARRKEHIPLQYLLGTAWFCGLEFLVDERVLIPRADTEVLVEEVLKDRKADAARGEMPGEPLRILDLCAGSGCIGLSTAWYLQKDETPFALTEGDLSEGALAVVKMNARCLGLPCECVQTDMFAGLEGRTFDWILSNPPYIAAAEIEELMEEVRDFEPRMALDGGADGLDFYRQIAQESGRFLADGGRLYLEIGYDQGETVPALLKDAGFQEIAVVKDLAGNPRVVKARK